METHSNRNNSLEPRVAKLEVGLDRLTDDVRSLGTIVRDQGSNLEKQLNDLTVAVTQAAGPRKIDWSVIISAALLIMTIGSAVFWPLNQTVSENKIEVQKLSEEFKSHIRMDNHPVGEILMHRLEDQLKSTRDSFSSDIKENDSRNQISHDKLEERFREEMKSNHEKINLILNGIDNRVQKLENNGK